MDKISTLPRAFDTTVLLFTFEAYSRLLLANSSGIRSVTRETHKYGPSPRHFLDIYFPDTPSPPGEKKTVLIFFHGGGFFAGSRVNEEYAGGLIFGNIGRYFTWKLNMTVIVPDYRLLEHGAMYPSGGEDVAFVVKWVREKLGLLKEGYGKDGVDIVLLGNSAGGVHVAAFLFDPVFEEVRRDVDVGLRGVIFLGTPFHWGGKEQYDENVERYLGKGKVGENAPIGILEDVIRRTGSAPSLKECKVLIMLSEFDPEVLFESARDLENVWKGQEIETQVLEGHNHFSPQLGLGTGIEREEAWGVRVAEFISSCVDG
ncbi:Alpha/Beta hydrolase protein [Poronia punctata]|nr:Alpha/Beta hydrolase protein [Poronia punctata]